MTIEEARKLLTLYADGLLDPAQVHELEEVLARTPELQTEYRIIKDENTLIAEALAPLRPTQSTRMRLSEAMQDVHRDSEELAVRARRMSLIIMGVVILGLCCILLAGWLYYTYRHHK